MRVQNGTQRATRRQRVLGTGTAGLVALISGLISVVCAILIPILPVSQTTAEFSWPQNDSTTAVNAPLPGYYPQSLDATIPCSVFDDLDPDSGQHVLLSTAPETAGTDARDRGLFVTAAGGNVEIRSRNVVVATATLAALTGDQGCEQLKIHSDGEVTSATFEGLASENGPDTGGAVTDRDLRPQVVGIYSSLQGPPPDGLSAHVDVDSRYSTTATALKVAAVVLGIVALIAALIALHRLDTRDDRPTRRFFARYWWRPRLLDGVVLATLVIWYFVGANTADDGYIFTEARAAAESGYMTEYFRYFAAPYAPFGMPYYLYTALSQISVASTVLRIPTLLFALGSWLLLSREVIPRLGVKARHSTIAQWTTAGVFLAFWLTFNNGIRPEPIIAFGVLATWVSIERSVATSRLLPLAIAFIVGGLTLSAAPTGTFCIAVIIVAARPLLLMFIRRARRDGVLPLLLPLLAAGTSVLFLVFWDSTLQTTLQSTELLGNVGPSGAWWDEILRYQWLFNQTADGSLARRFAVLSMLLCLGFTVAMLWRHRRIPGIAVGPAYRIAGLTALSIAFMAFNPTKWTHHFGAFASIAAAIAAVASLALLPTALRSIRSRLLFMGALAFILALSFRGQNSWWFVSNFGVPSGGEAPQIAGIALASVFFAVCILCFVGALAAHLIAPLRRLPDPRPEHYGRLLAVADAPLAVAAWGVVAICVVSFAAATAIQYPAFSIGKSNLRTLQGNPCALGDEVLAEPDTNAGVLTPLGTHADPLRAADAVGFDPNGIPGDLTTKEKTKEGQISTNLGDEENTSEGTAGTTGGRSEVDGINGSHVKLPFGLDPLQMPVIGSYQSGPFQGTSRTTTSWYSLPEQGENRPLITIAAAGRFTSSDLTIEAGTEQNGQVTSLGTVPFIDIGPEPTWRNLRVPISSLPEGTTTIRLRAVDSNPDPSRWMAFTAPRVPVLEPMQSVVGDAPVLPDWGVAFYVPCMHQFNEYAGVVTETPEYRILPDRPLAAVSRLWQGADGGGPLGFTDLYLNADTIPTYLNHDWGRDWGALEKFNLRVPDSQPAQVEYGTATRSGLWDGGGPLPR